MSDRNFDEVWAKIKNKGCEEFKLIGSYMGKNKSVQLQAVVSANI
jgi:hypothetical protein